MEDNVSSTTEEVKLLQGSEEQSFHDTKPFAYEDEDDILDLAGGAQDALARHRATNPPEPKSGGLENQAEDADYKGETVVKPVHSKSNVSSACK